MSDDLNKDKVDFLAKIFFYENPKKALLKSVIILVILLLTALILLIFEFTSPSIFFGILSLVILIRVFENIKRIKDENR